MSDKTLKFHVINSGFGFIEALPACEKSKEIAVLAGLKSFGSVNFFQLEKQGYNLEVSYELFRKTNADGV